jgi:hypothetical protein
MLTSAKVASKDATMMVKSALTIKIDLRAKDLRGRDTTMMLALRNKIDPSTIESVPSIKTNLVSKTERGDNTITQMKANPNLTLEEIQEVVPWDKVPPKGMLSTDDITMIVAIVILLIGRILSRMILLILMVIPEEACTSSTITKEETLVRCAATLDKVKTPQVDFPLEREEIYKL